MTDFTTTEIQLARRPEGWPVPEDFNTAPVTHPALEPGQVRVRNEFISVDPYMRGRMNDTRSYVAPYPLGEAIAGGAIGRVVHRGRQVTTSEATLIGHDGKLYAHASTTCLLFDIPG